jgi:hypothetical protein
VVAVTPAFINNCPAPRLKTVAILRAGFSGTSVAEESELKLPEVMTVDEIDRFAVTVPLIAGSEPIVTLLRYWMTVPAMGISELVPFSETGKSSPSVA